MCFVNLCNEYCVIFIILLLHLIHQLQLLDLKIFSFFVTIYSNEVNQIMDLQNLLYVICGLCLNQFKQKLLQKLIFFLYLLLAAYIF